MEGIHDNHTRYLLLHLQLMSTCSPVWRYSFDETANREQFILCCVWSQIATSEATDRLGFSLYDGTATTFDELPLFESAE